MEKVSIAIISTDKSYNDALAMSLVSVYPDFDIKEFSPREFLNQSRVYEGGRDYYKTFDIVLWAGNEIYETYGDNIVFLTDKASLIVKDYNNSRFSLYKYSGAHNLVGEIFEIYSHLTGRGSLQMRKENVRLFGFASCCGGSGCSTIARAVGQEFSRFYDMRVLLISFEEVESTGDMMPSISSAKTSGEYLYKLLSHREKMGVTLEESFPFIESYIISNNYGLETFSPCIGKNPLRDINRDDIQRFIASLMDSGRYDVVVADLSSCLTEAGIATMRLAEKICLICQPYTNLWREESYLSQVICHGGEETINKFIKIKNMAVKKARDKNILEEDIYGEKNEMLTIFMEISKSERDKKTGSIAAEGCFADEINKLATHLIS